MHDDLSNLMRLIDGHTYLEVIIRTGDKVSMLGYLRSELMQLGNTVQQDLDEGRKVITFLRGLADKFESELTSDNVLETRKDYGDDVAY